MTTGMTTQTNIASLHGGEIGSNADKRDSVERRSYTVRTLYNSIVAPRRFHGRRSADRRYPVQDKFESALGFLALGLVVLSIMDSVFTLTLLAHGGKELNPFMNWVLGYGVTAFMVVKMLLTAIPAVILVAANNIKLFGLIRARSLLGAMVGLYAGLIVYELGLLNLALSA